MTSILESIEKIIVVYNKHYKNQHLISCLLDIVYRRRKKESTALVSTDPVIPVFSQKYNFSMLLDPLNPNLASVFRFEASVPINFNLYHENVNFFKMIFYRIKRDFGLQIRNLHKCVHYCLSSSSSILSEESLHHVRICQILMVQEWIYGSKNCSSYFRCHFNKNQIFT